MKSKLSTLKTLFVICCLSLVFVAGCKKEDMYASEGTITGQDPRMCACCGGWFIQIGEATYRFYQLPKSSTLDLNKETLPLQVALDWTQDPNACMKDLIVVQKIKKK